MALQPTNLEIQGREQIYFSFSLGEDDFFFALSAASSRVEQGLIVAPLPSAVFELERREYPRVRAAARPIELHAGSMILHGVLLDESPGGMGIRLFDARSGQLPHSFELRARSTPDQLSHAILRHVEDEGEASRRVGVSVSSVPSNSSVVVEQKRFRSARAFGRPALATRVALSAAQRAATRLFPSRPVDLDAPPHVVEYRNRKNERIRALVDSYGPTRGAPAVVIPPAWGKTKETLLPLARTLVETFASQNEPIVVLRFDGTHRRGESHISPENRAPGREYLGFRFSRAVEDLQATLRFLSHAEEFATEDIVLITFSLAAIDGRRAVASDAGRLVKGWIPVVGMTDLQSGLRSVSGGIDFAVGIEKGVRFGIHELVGVPADMDATGRDALDHRLVYLEDARRDFEQIKVPITWIHGDHDSWVDAERVKSLMAAGSGQTRRFVRVPTGHQMRTSGEALDTFRLIASEASEFLLGRRLPGRLPRLDRLEDQRRMERARRPFVRPDLRSFWVDYLLGKSRRSGMDLLVATSAYQEFMVHQVELLSLDPDETLLDLGAGTGGSISALAGSASCPKKTIASDMVLPGLERARRRAKSRGVGFSAVCVDFDRSGFPFADCSVDAVLLSFVLGYLARPESVLEEARRVLRPNGRLVVSSLRRDADISAIYLEGVREAMAAARSGGEFLDFANYESLQQGFLNDAARILNLEELGVFHFYDERDLEGLLLSAGFSHVKTSLSFGSPPQASVAVARK